MDASIATISGNTIRNLTHTGALSGAGLVNGIQVGNPAVATVSQNTISNLTHTGTGSVIGINNDANSSAGQTISGNIVHSLSNTHTTAAVSVTGIRYNGPATGTNLVYAQLRP